MVVISIIGTMSSVVLSALNDTRAKARDSQRVQILKEIQKALTLYYNDNGRYPENIITTSLTVPEYGLNCWDCASGGIPTGCTWCSPDDNFPLRTDSYYDANRLAVLEPYLKTRQSDPAGPAPRGWTDGDPDNYRGFWYKVSASGQDYKIAFVRTVEDMNNVPDSMKDTSYLSIAVPSNNISMYTENAASWTIFDDVSSL